MFKIFKDYKKKKKWRKLNKHNNTFIKNVTSINNISVGSYSYGPLNVYSFGNENEKLIIGNYVSIADNVNFITGGEHYHKSLFTFPLRYYFNNEKQEALTKGHIIIDDNVWIGFGSTILSGVHISTGCIIAAGSVITKSTEPFCIYGGNPAVKIRSRFDNNLLEKIQHLDLNKITKNISAENIDLLYSVLDEEKLNKITDVFLEGNNE